MSDFNLYDGNNSSNNNSSNNNSNSYYDPQIAQQTQARQASKMISGTATFKKGGLFGARSEKNQAFRNTAELNSMELDDRKYYAAIGAFLLWGLGINFLLVKLFAKPGSLNLGVVCVVYIISAIVGIIVQMKAKSFVGAFIGYNLICVPLGLVLAAILPGYTSTVITSALIGTVLISALMMVAGFVFSSAFEKIGPALLVSLGVAIIADVILMLFFRQNVIILEYVFLVIFALYIGFDMSRAAKRPRTLRSAIDIAIDLYLDIINIFIRLLIILSDSKN